MCYLAIRLRSSLHGLHGIPTLAFGQGLGCEYAACGLMGLRLLRCRRVTRGRRFGCCIFEKTAVLLEITCEGFDLISSLGKIIVPAKNALGEIRDSIGVRGSACGYALEFYRAGVSLGPCFTNLVIKHVAVIDADGVFSVHTFELHNLAIDQFAKTRDLFGRRCLFSVHL